MPQSLWFFGTCFTIIADHTTTEGQYDLLEVYFPPGKQTPLHLHRRYSEQLYMLEGELTLWAGENKLVLNTGENFLIPIGTPHVVAALGDQPAHGLMIAAPSAFARLVKGVGTEDKNDAPDMALFNRISAEIGDEILGPPGNLPSAVTKT